MRIIIKNHYGLNFTDIPEEDVPFNYNTLENYDMLENKDKQHLLYYKKEHYYRFINNDVDRFISGEQMMGECNEFSFITNNFEKSPWRKL